MAHTHHQPAHYARYDRAYLIGIAINLAYVGVEGVAGWWLGSVALLSDAGHNLTDVLVLGLAYGASLLGRQAATDRRTYGHRRATILASLISALLLCAALGAVIWEAAQRLYAPAPVDGLSVVAIAAVGVVVNAGTAVMLMGGRHHDLNMKGAFLHMAADAAVSGGVVISGLLIYWRGWLWVDPVTALLVAALVLASGIGLMRQSIALTLDAVPPHVETAEVRRYLEGLEGVDNVHHLHIWAVSTTETALTVHLVRPPSVSDNDQLLRRLHRDLRERFGIGHPTVQIEHGGRGAEHARGPAGRRPPPGVGEEDGLCIFDMTRDPVRG